MIIPDEMALAAETRRLDEVFGWELRIDMGGCDPAVIDSIDLVTGWLYGICTTIRMTPYREPIVARFGEGHLHGITGILRITTSTVQIHCDPPRAGAYVNIFSCRRFDTARAERFTVAYFRATSACADLTVRGVPAVGR